MRKFLFLLEKILYFLIALGIVTWFIFAIHDYTFEWKEYYFKAGEITAFIYLSIGVLVLKWILEWLLKWEVRSAFGLKKRKRRQE